jgi:hypothetical protein
MMGYIRRGAADHRHHPPEYGLICPEKIDQCGCQYQDKANGKSPKKKYYFSITDQFPVVGKIVCFKKIKKQEKNRYDCIIDTILQKRICGGS